MRRLCCLLFFALLLPAAMSAATIVAPSGHAAVEGNEANSFPFNNFTGRYQQAYDANQFGASPISISEIAFRTDVAPTAMSWLSQLEFSLRMSTSANPVGSLSTTFDDNVGGDDTLIYTSPPWQPMAAPTQAASIRMRSI